VREGAAQRVYPTFVLSGVMASLFVKGHGGFGGERGPRAERREPPARAADRREARTTLPVQTLLWRHAGNDPNAIHLDPELAARAGFRAPILSGLNTLGFACRALVHAVADGAPERLRSLAGRFASPGYNGDALTTEIWTGDDLGRDARGDCYVSFRVVDQHGAVLIEHGIATLADP
jgi:acyl dehydratase